MKTSTVLTGTAIAAAVGYAIADGLARACSYAEEVENDEFCRTPLPEGSAVAQILDVHPPEILAVPAQPHSLPYARAGH